MIDPHSPFPLIQQCEHPSTGEVVWGIHPCQVGFAVEEIIAAEGGSSQDGIKDGLGRAMEDGNEQREKRGLKWLETWLMLSSGVVDLRA